MTTIDFKDVEIYQNPEKGKTVAVASGLELDAYMDFLKKSNTDCNKGPDFFSIPEEVMMPSTIKAISTCHDSDNWDADRGKKQAYYKLLRSYNKIKNRALHRFIDKNLREVEILKTMSEECVSNVKHYDQLVRNPKDGGKNG